MKFCILMGSPRLSGTTAEILKPIIKKLKEEGAEVKYITLADKNVNSCCACYKCQNVNNEYGCVQKDDMYKIVEDVMWSDCLILASPIYSWYCTAEMKCVLDRFYGMNKFYGSAEGTLWDNKKIALVTTNGYGREYGAGPFELGMKRFCEHSKLNYLGMYSVQDNDDLASFRTEEAVKGAIDFAEKLANKI